MEQNIHKAKRLIQYQLERPAGFPAIADRLQVNYHTLRKQFYRQEGMPMTRYYQQRRLEVAERLLKNRNTPIAEITTALGFSAASNFTRWFKGLTGITPSRYRKRHG